MMVAPRPMDPKRRRLYARVAAGVAIFFFARWALGKLREMLRGTPRAIARRALPPVAGPPPTMDALWAALR